MKITRKKIQAATDYRTFDGLTLDELKESNFDIYYDFFYDVRNKEDVDTVYISKNPDCPYVGVLDTDGRYYVYRQGLDEDGPGWYQVNFNDFFNYLK